MKASGNTILVTGGNSGIGFALAKRFLQEGNTVIITGRNAEKLRQCKEEFPALQTYCVDHMKPDMNKVFAGWLAEHFPSLNVLVNNAGVQFNYEFSEGEAAQIEEEIRANLSSPLLLTRLLLPLLLHQKQAAIVNVSSALHLAPKRSAAVYCATKAAMHSFTTTLRYALEEKNVRVFELVPPLVKTAMTAGRNDSAMEPGRLAELFLRDFRRDRLRSYIGKAKLLRFVHHVAPRMAERILRNQ